MERQTAGLTDIIITNPHSTMLHGQNISYTHINISCLTTNQDFQKISKTTQQRFTECSIHQSTVPNYACITRVNSY